MRITRLAAILAIALAPLLLSACHTVSGVGEDLNAAGRTISHTAQDVEKKM